MISKQFRFSASHQLTGLHPGHKCGRLHGHNYIVDLVMQSNILDEHGFILDYGDMEPFKAYLQEHFDHRHLNEVLFDIQPTAENIAKYLYDFAHKTWPGRSIAVRISETQNTWASFSDSGL